MYSLEAISLPAAFFTCTPVAAGSCAVQLNTFVSKVTVQFARSPLSMPYANEPASPEYAPMPCTLAV